MSGQNMNTVPSTGQAAFSVAIREAIESEFSRTNPTMPVTEYDVMVAMDGYARFPQNPRWVAVFEGARTKLLTSIDLLITAADSVADNLLLVLLETIRLDVENEGKDPSKPILAYAKDRSAWDDEPSASSAG